MIHARDPHSERVVFFDTISKVWCPGDRRCLMMTLAQIALYALYGVQYLCLGIAAFYLLGLVVLIVGVPIWWVWAEHFSNSEPMEVAGGGEWVEAGRKS